MIADCGAAILEMLTAATVLSGVQVLYFFIKLRGLSQ